MEGLALADLADDVAETVDGPVELLVGHSLGALASLELVGRRPGFARRLVLEDPAWVETSRLGRPGRRD